MYKRVVGDALDEMLEAALGVFALGAASWIKPRIGRRQLRRALR